VCNFETHQSELAPCRHEDMCIDDQHNQQWDQHAAKEIEINHVVQGNHFLKQALGHPIGAAVVSSGSYGGVPTCIPEEKLIY